MNTNELTKEELQIIAYGLVIRAAQLEDIIRGFKHSGLSAEPYETDLEFNWATYTKIQELMNDA